MRYTKYQYKKKKNGMSFFTSILIMIVGAGAIGLIIGTVIFNTIGPSIKPKSQGGTETSVTIKEVFQTIQCGYFSKEENANKILNSIGKNYNSFIANDAGKFRVLAGVFTDDATADKILTELKGQGVEATKMKFTLNEGDVVQKQVSAIADGYFEIVATLKDDEVKAVATGDFKEWTKKLPEITEGEKKEVVSEFKKHIDELPTELKKENLTDELKYIYTILINFNK